MGRALFTLVTRRGTPMHRSYDTMANMAIFSRAALTYHLCIGADVHLNKSVGAIQSILTGPRKPGINTPTVNSRANNLETLACTLGQPERRCSVPNWASTDQIAMRPSARGRPDL